LADDHDWVAAPLKRGSPEELRAALEAQEEPELHRRSRSNAVSLSGACPHSYSGNARKVSLRLLAKIDAASYRQVARP